MSAPCPPHLVCVDSELHNSRQNTHRIYTRVVTEATVNVQQSGSDVVVTVESSDSLSIRAILRDSSGERHTQKGSRKHDL